MRTTITIDDELLRELKQEAARSGRRVSDLVDDGLRLLLGRRHAAPSDRAVTVPTFGGSGLRPGVDLEDKEGLAALLDDGSERRAAG